MHKGVSILLQISFVTFVSYCGYIVLNLRNSYSSIVKCVMCSSVKVNYELFGHLFILGLNDLIFGHKNNDYKN
jgi:hypothetical protein